MSQDVNAALARKLSVGQKDLGDRPRSVLRALRLGFARAAGDRLNLPLAVIGAKQSNQSQEVPGDAAGQDWLLLVFDGPEGRAAACLNPNVVSAIVQAQTIGQVLSGDPGTRTFTDTDAAIVAPLIEAALTGSAALFDASSDQICLAGLEFTSRAKDLRTLSLAMTEEAYRIFELTVDLANGEQQGHISVFLPEHPAVPDVAEDAGEKADLRMDQCSGVMRAELTAALCRMSLPLSDLSGMRIGDILPLRGARLDRTEVLTIDRTRAGIGRLGQCGGLRAVRLNETAALPALTGADAQDFIASKSGTPPQDYPVEPAEHDAHAQTVPAGVSDLTDSDLIVNDSERMVAEITQLAGLAPPESTS